MELLYLAAGVVVGLLIALLAILRLRGGILYVVRTYLEDTPQTLLELDNPISELTKKRYILLKIDNISTRK